MGEAFNVQKLGKCKRKDVCVVRDLKKKHGHWEYGNNVCFQTMCNHTNQKMDVSTKQHYTVKFYARLKKLKVETIALLKEAFQILVVSIVEMWTAWWELRKDAQVIQETWMIFRCIPKEEFETTIKKISQRMEVYLATNGWYFEKENVKCTALESEIDVSKWICVFCSFFFLHATVLTKPPVTWDLFDIQTSADTCWKGNAQQNVRFVRIPTDNVTSLPGENEHQFWDNLVFL